MVQAYRTDDPWSGVARGYGLGNALRVDVVRSRAGSAIAGGDYAGGANALLSNGEVESGLRVQDYGQRQQVTAAAKVKATEEEGLKFTSDIAGRLAEVHRSSKDVNKTLAAFDQVAPQLSRYDTPDEIAALRQQIAADPDNTLLMLGAGAAKKAGLEVRNVGDEVLVIDPADGRVVNRYRGARTVNVAEGGALYEIPGEGGSDTVGEGHARPAAAAAPQPNAAPSAGSVRAIVESLTSAGAKITSGKRTSEHNAAVGGAKSSYHLTGHAYDIVPPPGMSMAQLEAQLRSTGVNFAELINEGDHVHIAWGRDEPTQPFDVAAVGDTPAPPSGPRLLVQRPPRPKEPKERATPSGYEYQPDGTLAFIPGGPADPQAQKAGGKVTEGERTAGFLSSRLADSLANLVEISASDPNADKPGFLEAAASVVDRTGTAANLARDTQRQQVIANQLDILDAALTLGTGAAYTREQLLNYQATYFPLLTDKPETVTAKRQKLISLLTAAKIKAGPAAPPQLDQALEAAKKQFGMAPAGGGQVRDVRTPAEAQALPPGARFRTPDGQIRVRK